MRIALVTEGTYPTAHGGVSVWCDQVIAGLPEHSFDVHAIVASDAEPIVWAGRTNVSSLTMLPLWGTPRLRHPRRAETRRFLGGLSTLVDAMFQPGPDDAHSFLDALQTMRTLAQDGLLTSLMRSRSAIDLVLERWRRSPMPGRELGPDEFVPQVRVSDVVISMTLLEHYLRPLSSPTPVADVCHTVSNGLTSLVALNAKWTHGVPFLLTEHGLYLRERYLEFRNSEYSFAVRAFALRFFRLLTSATYTEADFITPGSEYNLRWQVRRGAEPGRVQAVYNGVDPSAFPAGGEPERPTLIWVGRIAPIKDVESLIKAFDLVRRQIPQARLRLYGSAPPGSEDYLARCVRLVDALGLTGQVSFEGRIESIVAAYHAGNVVVLSSASEGFPYTVIEAMASGRATVSTDVGGVREAVGDTGLVVPPRDPSALAAACVRLLEDRELRQGMADAARARAQTKFTLDQFLKVYRGLYPALASADFAPIDVVRTMTNDRATEPTVPAPQDANEFASDASALDPAPADLSMVDRSRAGVVVA